MHAQINLNFKFSFEISKAKRKQKKNINQICGASIISNITYLLNILDLNYYGTQKEEDYQTMVLISFLKTNFFIYLFINLGYFRYRLRFKFYFFGGYYEKASVYG